MRRWLAVAALLVGVALASLPGSGVAQAPGGDMARGDLIGQRRR
jgi:hypothetical protein